MPILPENDLVQLPPVTLPVGNVAPVPYGSNHPCSALLLNCFSTAGKIIAVIMVGVKESLWSLNLNELTQELLEAFHLASLPSCIASYF